MRVVELVNGFGVENLRLTERALPTVKAGEVLVQMGAASLNYRDLLMVRGLYNPRQRLPLVPCSDGAGTVVAVGDGVRDVTVGTRVIPAFAQAWLSGEPTRELLSSTLGGPLDGTLCEHRVFDPRALVQVPEHLSLIEAATLPCAALTAWRALFDHGGLLPGQWVLVQGSGGVSVFALQFAKQIGARVIATTSSAEKAARLRELGAEVVINYRDEPQWSKRVREVTDSRGVDVIVEVGGAGTLEQSLRAIKVGGRVSLIGVLSGGSGEVNLLPVLMQDVRVQGVIVGSRAHLQQMCDALAAWRLHPVVDRVFAMEDIAEAMTHMASGAHLGKVAVEIAS
ncbi:MAG: NAD(P)-dependent alcohol dehydrogenase [Deltaproteobacteria bacterium]|nr:NAD(P)-dependent alcohol dehydrogenase [Deltaproteobacteria bacterium]